MTLRQIELVQQSFRLIQPNIDDLAILFYKRLFAIDPSLRRMFHRSRREQALLLAQTLSVVVKGIDRPSQLRADVEALGQRHAGYGVLGDRRRGARVDARKGAESRIHVRGARRLGGGVWLAGVHDAARRSPPRGCRAADRHRRRGVNRGPHGERALFTVRPLMKPRTAVVTIAVNTRTFVRATVSRSDFSRTDSPSGIRCETCRAGRAERQTA